jgi:hypothetical protein
LGLPTRAKRCRGINVRGGHDLHAGSGKLPARPAQRNGWGTPSSCTICA